MGNAKKSYLSEEAYFPASSSKASGKSAKFLAQQKRAFKAFFGPPKSMLEVEAETGIMRSNICWYVREWQERKSIKRVLTGVCSITKMKVGKYSSNPLHWGKEVDNAG